MVAILFSAITIFAQSPLPPLQIARVQPYTVGTSSKEVDPIVNGSSLWLPLSPDGVAPVRMMEMRVAAIDSLDNDLTHDVQYKLSANMLRRLVLGQHLFVYPIKRENYIAYDELKQMRVSRQRLVGILHVAAQKVDGSFIGAANGDVGYEMLRLGAAWLVGWPRIDLWSDELMGTEYIQHYAAMMDARANQRGIWRWYGDLWIAAPVERSAAGRNDSLRPR